MKFISVEGMISYLTFGNAFHLNRMMLKKKGTRHLTWKQK